MKITVAAVQPRDEINKVWVRVLFQSSEGPPYNNGAVEVFVEPTDSVQEIRRRAIEASRDFLQRALTTGFSEITKS